MFKIYELWIKGAVFFQLTESSGKQANLKQ